MALRARATPLTTRAAMRFYSSADEIVPPPLLQKLKGDLKTAMRAKDTHRLSVLRTIMSANLNASKTSTPIKTDVQLVALMRKISKAAEDAASEATAAGREDLAEKENAQIAIISEYVKDSGVATLGEAELRSLVEGVVAEIKAAGAEGKSMMGEVMKKLNAAVEGKDVDKKSLADMVKSIVSK